MRWLLPICLVFSFSTAMAAEEVTPATEATATTIEKTSGENTEAVNAVTAEQISPALPPAKDNRQESEIPLNLDGPKKAANEGSGVLRYLFTVSILGVIAIGAFIFLRKYKIPKASKHQTQIKVLQQHYLGPKKSLAIIRVAGESILIGITDHNISMIKNLSLLDDEVPEEAPRHFGKVLGNIDMQEEANEEPVKPSKVSNKRAAAATELDPDEEFAISGIKDIVSKRLKGMRSL
jgi:flagellar protein FliO/FliZ